ncbi:MAG: GldG family protein [Myxococcota bacterium]
MDQRTRAATESLGFLAITVGIFFLLNFLGVFAFFRLDWTANDSFSLSDGSEDLAGELTDKLVITAYFTEDLPPPFNATERYVRDILVEYENAGGGKIEVNFVNPDSDTLKEEAEEAGVQKVSHQAIKDDGLSVVEGFRGLVMEYLDQREVIPVIEDTRGLEYAITMKLKRMVGDQTSVAVLGGHDGPSLTQGLSRLRACMPQYSLTEVAADAELSVEEYSALVIVEPHTSLSEDELKQINRYVMTGGSLGVFGPTMKITLDAQTPGAVPTASASESGLNQILRPWGVVSQVGIVHDTHCGQAPLQTNIGMLPVPHPPVPMVNFDDAQSDHPVAFRLDSTLLPFTSPLELVGDGDNALVLAASSEESWLVSDASVELQPRMPREWGSRTGEGNYPLIAAIEGSLSSAFEEEGVPSESENEVRILVAGSSMFLRDEALPQQDPNGECQLSSNLAFALNAMDWLAQDNDLIAIRAKNVEDPQIDVPRNVEFAEEEARSAAAEAQEAQQKQLESAIRGDEQGAAEASGEVEEAQAEVEAALERRENAVDEWNNKKQLYRFSNMLGIPLIFAIGGILWWFSRRSKNRRIKL